MTDERRFDDLLREDAAALPPPAAGEINPWSMAMTRVLWGLGLITITLNFLYLDVILPAVGGLLLVLGFCTLRRENTPLRWCYILSLASLAVRGACIVLAALPVETGLAPAYVNIALLQVLYVCLWRGMVGVSRAAGEEKPAATAAGAMAVFYAVLTVLALSGVTADGDGASTKSAEVRLGDVQNSGAHLAVEAPSEKEIRLDGVQENTGQKAEVRLSDVRNDAPHFAAKAPSAREFRLGDVQENGDLTGKVRHEDVREKAVQKAEIRLGDVRKPDDTAEDGQVSHEFFGGDGSDRTDPILGGVSDFVPQNLALSEENDRFSAPLELPGNTKKVSGQGSNLHESESEAGEALHEMKSDLTAARRRGLHENRSEVEEPVHEMKSESAAARRRGLHESRSEVEEAVHEMKSESAAERREGLHESKSEVRETVHETKSELTAIRREGLHESESEVGEVVHESKSESVERFAEGLLEGLRRAAAVR